MGSSEPAGDEEAVRRNTTTACDHCRRSKIKCDGASPCSQCKKTKRDCLYSPRRRRGPVPKTSIVLSGILEKPGIDHPPGTLSADNHTSQMASFILNHYLQVFIGHVASFFKVGKFGLISGDSIFERSLSKPSKLQLFAALAGSARACGNIEFSEKLFGYACKISRELYDDLSSNESSIATALGFTILGNAASATNRRKGKFYMTIARALSQSIETEDQNALQVKNLIRIIQMYIAPMSLVVSMSIPLSSDHTAVPTMTKSLEMSSNPVASSFFNDYLRALSSGDSQEAFSKFSLEQFGAVGPFSVLEFTCFTKYILFYYYPRVQKIFENDDLTEDLTNFAPGGIPVKVAHSLIESLEKLPSIAPPNASALQKLFATVFIGFLFYSVEKFDQALHCISEVLKFYQNPDYNDQVIISPPYTAPPCLFLMGVISVQLGSLDLVDKAILSLSIYDKIGFVNSITGLKTLKKLRNQMESQSSIISVLASKFGSSAPSRPTSPPPLTPSPSPQTFATQSAAATTSTPGTSTIMGAHGEHPTFSTPASPLPNKSAFLPFDANKSSLNSLPPILPPVSMMGSFSSPLSGTNSPHTSAFSPIPQSAALASASTSQVSNYSFHNNSSDSQLIAEPLNRTIDLMYSFWDQENENEIMSRLAAFLE